MHKQASAQERGSYPFYFCDVNASRSTTTPFATRLQFICYTYWYIHKNRPRRYLGDEGKAAEANHRIAAGAGAVIGATVGATGAITRGGGGNTAAASGVGGGRTILGGGGNPWCTSKQALEKGGFRRFIPCIFAM